MNVYELLEATGGHILMNKAHVTVDGIELTVGYFDGPELVFTEEGSELAAKTLAPKARKKAAVVVESADTTE
jgi:riboflavin synthase alpha subunit